MENEAKIPRIQRSMRNFKNNIEIDSRLELTKRRVRIIKPQCSWESWKGTKEKSFLLNFTEYLKAGKPSFRNLHLSSNLNQHRHFCMMYLLFVNTLDRLSFVIVGIIVVLMLLFVFVLCGGKYLWIRSFVLILLYS